MGKTAYKVDRFFCALFSASFSPPHMEIVVIVTVALCTHFLPHGTEFFFVCTFRCRVTFLLQSLFALVLVNGQRYRIFNFHFEE